MEMWKSIPIWNAYEASSIGRIRRKETGHIVKQRFNYRGYLRVNLSMGMSKTGRGLMVHRLVLDSFTPNRFNLPMGSHLNGDRTDNRIENLYWATAKDNHEDRLRHGTYPFGENASRAKFTDQQYSEILELLKTHSLNAVAKIFNTNKHTIHSIKRRKVPAVLQPLL